MKTKSVNIEVKIKPWFTQFCDYLWDNRKMILKKYYSSNSIYDIGFEFPTYCGLPKRIYTQLTGDFVDLLQQNLYYFLQLKSKKHFVKAIINDIMTSGYDCNVIHYTVK